jgi:sugar phosphate isomerase/epimerase
MLFVALSSLQGRPMSNAFDELARLEVAIQLTPGNFVTRGFREHVARSGVTTRAHHGFAWTMRRTETWSADGACLVASESVHPPKSDAPAAATWWQWFERAPVKPILETMYPGYTLGDGEAIERLMDDGVVLAVDISHVFIQRTQGTMTEATWRRLCDYDRIAEVHVSANGGEHDSHRPLGDTTFGLAWARAKLAAGTPTVLECYMHKLSDGDRRRQLELVRGAA